MLNVKKILKKVVSNRQNSINFSFNCFDIDNVNNNEYF